jgi:transposase
MMDTLSPHKAGCLRNAVEAAGVAYRSLPPYRPDLNPIEPAWAVVKEYLRRAEARSLDERDAAMPQTLNQITPSHAQGWFRRKGYRSN